jgi:AmiR/NasT family two-component response regulator
VPSDLGQLIGQAAFEQARGVLMEICGYTAAEALTSLSEAARRTRTAPEVLVIALRATPSFAVVRFDLCH